MSELILLGSFVPMECLALEEALTSNGHNNIGVCCSGKHTIRISLLYPFNCIES